MFEDIETRVEKNKRALPVDYSRRSVLARMTDSKAYADCFSACAERNAAIDNYNDVANPAYTIAIGALLFGGLACLAMLLVRQQPTSVKIGVLIIALVVSLILMLLLRELILNRIARKIAIIEDHVDSHYAVRPGLVDKVQYELQNDLDDNISYPELVEDDAYEAIYLGEEDDGGPYMDSPFSEDGLKLIDFPAADNAADKEEDSPFFEPLAAHWELDEPELANVLAERVKKIAREEDDGLEYPAHIEGDTIEKVLLDLGNFLYRLRNN